MTTERERLDAKVLRAIRYSPYGEDHLVAPDVDETLCGIAVDGEEYAGRGDVCTTCLEIAGVLAITGEWRYGED